MHKNLQQSLDLNMGGCHEHKYCCKIKIPNYTPNLGQVANNKNTKSLDYDVGGCHEDNYCCKSREYGEENEAEPIQNLESKNIIVRYCKRL